MSGTEETGRHRPNSRRRRRAGDGGSQAPKRPGTKHLTGKRPSSNPSAGKRPGSRSSGARQGGLKRTDSRDSPFHPYEEIADCIEQVLATSIADETEIVWLERRFGRVSSRAEDAGFFENPRLSVLVRVVEGGRQGWYRTDTSDPHLLESGIRQALAMSRVSKKLKKRPILPKFDDEYRAPRRLLDPEISRLHPETAKEHLLRLCEENEEAGLSWTDTRLVIFNSHGLRRSAASTEATLRVESGRGPGAGYAAASARRLSNLDAEELRDRARRYRNDDKTATLPETAAPVLVSPEAAIELLNILNAFAFSGRSFLDGTSFLSRHRNIQVFDRKVNLCDDGTAHGLPFPFDFEGSRKRPLDLIVDGKPSTPALNQTQGAQTGLEPTAQSVGGQDALFSNLFLLPGDIPEEGLLEAASGGVRIGRLERTECYEPAQLRVRAVARGVREIRNGRLGAPLPDFVWHESLLGALARLRALGDEPVVLSAPTTPLGGISSPAFVLEESSFS